MICKFKSRSTDNFLMNQLKWHLSVDVVMMVYLVALSEGNNLK